MTRVINECVLNIERKNVFIFQKKMLTKEEKAARQKRYDAKRAPRKQINKRKRKTNRIRSKIPLTKEQKAARQKMYDAKRSEETKNRKRLKGREYSKNRWLDPNFKQSQQEHKQINWEQEIIYNSRSSDKRTKRIYDENDYINIPFIRNLLHTQQELCVYCKIEMKFGKGINRNTNPQGLSCQRINNDMPHIQLNCVLCCMLCNMMSRNIPHETMVVHGKGLREGVLLYCPSEVHIGNRVVNCSDWYKNGKFGVHCKICTKKTRKSRAK